MVIERFGIYLATFDPTMGAEMGKTRPCVVICPDEMHRVVRTVLVAPLTSARKRYPTRVNCQFEGRDGQIALDQIRSFDRVRFIRKLGRLDHATASRVRKTLMDLFT